MPAILFMNTGNLMLKSIDEKKKNVIKVLAVVISLGHLMLKNITEGEKEKSIIVKVLVVVISLVV